MKNMTQEKIIILVSANLSTGFGHLVRCSSLAIALQKQGCLCHFQGDFSAKAMEFLNYFKLPYSLSQQPISQQLAEINIDTCCIVDSYQLHSDDLIIHKKTVLIDDFMLLPHYPVLGVINFTLTAIQKNYCALGASSQALGTKYFLPQASIVKQDRQLEYQQVNNLLIMIGSGDPYQLVSQLLDALKQWKTKLNIRILAAVDITDKLTLYPHQVECFTMQFDVNIHYQWADLCITSGGLAKYECAYLSIPSIVFSLTELEAQETTEFAAANLCLDFGLAKHFVAQNFIANFQHIMQNRQYRDVLIAACQRHFILNSAEHAATYTISCFK